MLLVTRSVEAFNKSRKDRLDVLKLSRQLDSLALYH